MSDWKPGDPLYSPDQWGESVGFVRPMVSVLVDADGITPAKAARWPEPYVTHDLDAQVRL